MDEPPYLLELNNAIGSLYDNKAPGHNQIPGEIFKHGGVKLEKTLHALICKVWENCEVPQDWKDA
jgi:hypothetical protein